MENNIKTEAEIKKETIQLEREQVREKIKELIEAEYARLEEEAARIAPEFDFEVEAEKLRAEEEAVGCQGEVEFVEDDTGLHPCPSFFGVDFQDFLEMLADVDHNTAAYHLSRNRSASRPRDEMGIPLLGFLDEIDDVLFVFREGNALGYLAIGRGIGSIGNAVERVGQ